MGVFSQLDAIFRYSKHPISEASHFFSSKGLIYAWEKASKEYDKWIRINNKEEDMGRYVGRPVWWYESDDFAFFANWLMRDMEKRNYTWQQIAQQMKVLAVTPHKYKDEFDKWHDVMTKNEELESLVDNNPDDGSWEGR
jgi:hypothetical protein|tara:strand:+ start:60 stop:476 length:417 start_codon:yes stop_codon:yes gene_type:complete